MAEPFDLTIAEASAGIREGRLSPVALVESLLQRVDRLEPHLKAWVTLDKGRALSAAQQSAKELQEKGPRGPLHGVPLAAKDIFYTADMKTTACSRVYADFQPAYDATAIARLKEAGAIILGKTVTTEFATTDPSPTHNPWNHEHTPGGSSSGSAAAVASRMCPGALGSQTGGSTLRPAAYNGIVGLKPTYGRISRYGVISVAWTLDTVGILVRTVEDAALLLNVLAGHDSRDPSSLDAPVPDYCKGLDTLEGTLRIGVVREFFFHQASDEVREHTEGVVQRLGEAGASVTEVSLPESFATVHPAQSIIFNAECAAYHQEVFASRKEEYGPILRSHIEMGMLTPAVDYLQAQRVRRRFRQDMEPIVEGVDVLLTPSTPTAAPRDLNTTGDPVFQTPWTYCGFPAISIPSGLDSANMPLGIQLVGAPLREERLLAVARWCESALGVELKPPFEG